MTRLLRYLRAITKTLIGAPSDAQRRAAARRRLYDHDDVAPPDAFTCGDDDCTEAHP